MSVHASDRREPAAAAATRTLSANPPAITLRGVTKRYNTHLALQATDLEIAEGEFFCLLGPIGLRQDDDAQRDRRIRRPSSGEIFIRGERVDRLPPHRRSVNTVFQSYALFPHMSVRDNVGFGLKMAHVPSSESAARIDEALALVGLERLRQTASPASSPADSNSASPWHGHSSTAPSCSSSTSRSARST